jgi:hypothetical protein
MHPTPLFVPYACADSIWPNSLSVLDRGRRQLTKEKLKEMLKAIRVSPGPEGRPDSGKAKRKGDPPWTLSMNLVSLCAMLMPS